MQDGLEIDGLVFASSNEEIATIDINGNIETISIGTTKITISGGPREVSFILTVMTEDSPILSLVVEDIEINLVDIDLTGNGGYNTYLAWNNIDTVTTLTGDYSPNKLKIDLIRSSNDSLINTYYLDLNTSGTQLFNMYGLVPKGTEVKASIRAVNRVGFTTNATGDIQGVSNDYLIDIPEPSLLVNDLGDGDMEAVWSNLENYPLALVVFEANQDYGVGEYTILSTDLSPTLDPKDVFSGSYSFNIMDTNLGGMIKACIDDYYVDEFENINLSFSPQIVSEEFPGES